MNLFIAEKPSVAKAIAGELGMTGKGDGFIQCGSDKVTWCFGHLLEQAEPDDYTPSDVPRGHNGKKVWRVDELPIIPTTWILMPKEDAKKQLTAIGKLLKEADVIVNAGDPDREGQLLVDEVLEHFNNTKPVRRFWVSAQDSVSVQRGLAALKDNTHFAGWADAAKARQRADWLIGMNLSRAYTLRAQRGGSRALLTVGRVQTPTLALVVARDREIEGFKPVPYHTIRAEIQHAGGSFFAAWKAKEDQAGLDSEGRLVDTAIANALVEKIAGKPVIIAEYKEEAKTQSQPLAFALSDITLLASHKFGYSAEEVLKACQALYETHKLTSYPRTDCAYLPESQHADAAGILAAIKYVNPELGGIVDGADPRIKSKTWNDSKITAHHGIIPTLHKGGKSGLSDQERTIYELIVRAYLAQFYPLHEYRQTTVSAEVESETFTANGKVITRNGWREVFQEADEDDKHDSEEGNRQRLPAMKQGDDVTCGQAARRDAKTKPPARFTEGTLTRAMENIHKFVSDPDHKKVLRDGDGIGTSATRASILSELKRREFLELKGKHIISTTLGRSVIDALPEVVKSPVLTALYERMLKGIEQGNTEMGAFIARQEDFIREQVAKANAGAVRIAGGKEGTPVSSLHKCMACGSGLSRRPSKKPGHFWWGCSNFPTCKQTYPELKGRPDYSKGRDNNQTVIKG
ncbi:DNA topoisomerase III [Methylotuvimicrobium alcaliphilum]|uniref:DNA topoisomerase n=1 Tax=Methylotuvimicrobium alcaliphilum (strain DSM 19304 / NCIMB 14124 / VKM B-2133 / 20Z) TaxID=1091494 RepID=G4T4P7_META2|nr:DNA topoisomerase III [Methylotuvimicrobium alcaliphilum]CCE25803.1 DNA topoisomerase 3 [Methylotuvimicrobium alcaliphilum 20Z]